MMNQCGSKVEQKERDSKWASSKLILQVRYAFKKSMSVPLMKIWNIIFNVSTDKDEVFQKMDK